MIIDGYVLPEGTEIEELQTKKGYVFYACNGSIARSKEEALRYAATGKICECGAFTSSRWSNLCIKCQHKLQHEKYLKIPCVPYIGQAVFVGEDYTNDLEQYLEDQLDGFTLDEILVFEIMEAEMIKVPEFNMSEFFEWQDYQYEDMEVNRDFDEAINALIKEAAQPVYTYGKNRVEIPQALLAKLRKAADEKD